MRYDYSLPQRSEDKWAEMHQSAREQRLAKRVERHRSSGRLLGLLRILGRLFLSVRSRIGSPAEGRR